MVGIGGRNNILSFFLYILAYLPILNRDHQFIENVSLLRVAVSFIIIDNAVLEMGLFFATSNVIRDLSLL